MNNRLQFRHHAPIFETRDDALEYIYSEVKNATEGLAFKDKSFGFSLFAEPLVVRYENEDDETDPHVILAIGSDTNPGVEDGHGQYSENRFCIIDIDKTEKEIEDLAEEVEKAIESLSIIALSSDTLNLYADKTDEGTFVSGDVKVAKTHIFDDVQKKNNLLVASDGLFVYINLTYDEDNESFTFSVSNADGTLSETTVELPNNYVVSGEYDKKDESLHLNLRDGEEVVIDFEELIAEWTVEGEASKTPIILTKEDVDYDDTPDHEHIEPWQDVLRADVRIKDEIRDAETGKYIGKAEDSINILDKTIDGRYLFVDGRASNVIYWRDGEKTNVKEVLDDLVKIKPSSDYDNIVINKPDGLFASAKLRYISSENTLVFEASNQEATVIPLNTVEVLENMYYDKTREVLVITYKDNKGETQFVEIPVGELITDWEWEVLNDGHNVKLIKTRVVGGNDKLSADVNILAGHNNILEDTNHSLYVRGEADNIKYGDDSNVKEALDDLNSALEDEIARATSAETDLQAAIEAEGQRAQDAEMALDEKIEAEETRATSAETIITNTIGSGFSTDTHETVTYKFNELTSTVETIETNLASEVERATEAENTLQTAIETETARATSAETVLDGKVEAIDSEIGDGFGPRNTVRDEIDALQGEIEAVSGSAASKLQDIKNIDHSIDVDKTNPTEPVIKVNLSTEVEDSRKNIIKLNNDGLFANVDLLYNPDSNKLTFHTSNGEPDKEIQLESMSSIIDIVYDASTEKIIITYMTNGHEVKTVEIPVGGLIDEWEVDESHDGAVQLKKTRKFGSEKDVLEASVVIASGHSDNILVNDNGALYVSGQQITDNKNALDALEVTVNGLEGNVSDLTRELSAETYNRILGDSDLRNDLNAEITRSTNKDNEHDTAISNLTTNLNNEIVRATSAETALHNADTTLFSELGRIQTDVNNLTVTTQEQDESIHLLETSAVTMSSDIDSLYVVSASHSEDIVKLLTSATTLNERLSNEINRSTTEDNRLNGLITTEISDRESAISDLNGRIDGIAFTVDETATARMNKSGSNVLTTDVKVSELDNIIIVDNGIRANVNLSYDSGRNVLQFDKTTPSGTTTKEIQLNAGSIIDSINYDDVNKQLVIVYHDAQGDSHQTEVNVSDLFNEWICDSNHFGAVHLEKHIGTGTGGADVLTASVVISDRADNILVNDNGVLYVDGKGIIETSGSVECVTNELKAAEYAIFGEYVPDCGNGFIYPRNISANYISAATSFNSADVILDGRVYDLYQLVEALEEAISGVVVTEDSTTVKFDSSNPLKASVKISSSEGNIISAKNDGIHASLDDQTLDCGIYDGPIVTDNYNNDQRQ